MEFKYRQKCKELNNIKAEMADLKRENTCLYSFKRSKHADETVNDVIVNTEGLCGAQISNDAGW